MSRTTSPTRTTPLDLSDQQQGVNLLPMSVRTARDARRLRARLAVGVIALAAVLAVTAGGVVVRERQAQHDLDLASDEADRLTTELAGYGEVSELRDAIERTASARTVGMGTEIRWVDLIERIEAVAPAGTTVTSFSAQGAAPGELTSFTPPDALATAGIGVITFSITSPTLPDTAAWLEALNGIPGLMDASFTTASLNTRDGAEGYTVASTVQVNVAALSGAYLDTTDPEDAS